MNTNKFTTQLKAITTTILLCLALNACTDADVASSNLSKAADMFELERRIVFYNGINGDYILTIEGKCSVSDSNNKLSVVCKTGVDEYKKHYLGLSDNVTYFSEQTDTVKVDVYRYRVIFKPEVIVPDVDLRVSD